MKSPLSLLITIFSALLILVLLSLCPWERWTDGRLKNFSLLSDLYEVAHDTSSTPQPEIDTELKLLDQSADSIAEEVVDTLPPLPSGFKAPKIDDIVLIEDFSPTKDGLEKLSDALKRASNSKMRIAVIGDSYIEGDIFVQDLRSTLQNQYGGGGVGYVAAHSNFPGYRSSVNQAGRGWTAHEIKQMKADSLRNILGQYHVSEQGANASFSANSKVPNYANWSQTTIVLQSSVPAEFTLSYGDNKTEYSITPSDSLQYFTINGVMDNVKFSTQSPGIKVLGFWLENATGVSVDDISLRGNSGLTHRQLAANVSAQLSKIIPYDLIILEFGLNVASSKQYDYTAYRRGMEQVINNLKTIYPAAQILVLGVGDRGEKRGGTVVSMASLSHLVDAQRDLARRTGSLFYDTREAMGGDGAAALWHSKKLINSDYVHLNHRGGKALADIFVLSLDKSLLTNQSQQ